MRLLPCPMGIRCSHMSRDREPLLFTLKLGALRALSKASMDALASLMPGDIVELVIKRARPNQRRMNLYWAVAGKAAENWPMAVGTMTSQMLHRETKENLGIGHVVETKKGRRIFDPDSISFADMTEDQRAAYITAAFALWSRALGVDVQTLLDEAKREAA